MIVNNELKRMWKVAVVVVVASFKVLVLHFLEGRTSVGTAVLWAEI
jgi:hypothetical protein